MNPRAWIESRSALWTAIAVSLATWVWHTQDVWPWILDDAFISFRYAEHFAAGHGLVYNVGDWVEGYTSFLWVLVLALGNWLHADTVTLSRILGVFFSFATLYLTANEHRFVRGGERSTSVTAVLFLGTSGLFVPWGTSGMEVALCAFLLLLCFLLYSRWLDAPEDTRRLVQAGVVLALAVMTRPEASLLGVVIAVDSLRRSWRAFVTVIASALVLYAPYFIWRYTYYGFLLPNTFYAKVEFTVALLMRGLLYAGESIWATLPLWVLAVVVMLLARASRSRVLLVYLVIHLAYVALIGGDCMPAFRFVAPVMPLLALLAAAGAARLSRKSALAVVVLVCGFNLAQLVLNDQITPAIHRDVVAVEGKEVGMWLRDHRPPETVIATNTAGSLPYYSRMRTIDMLGLNDKHIAHREVSHFGQGMAGHEKGDGEYVLALQPDLIQFASSIGSERPLFRTDHELFANPKFEAEYAPFTVQISSLGKAAVFFERRK